MLMLIYYKTIIDLKTLRATTQKKSSNQFFVYEAECNIVKTKYIGKCELEILYYFFYLSYQYSLNYNIDSKFLLNFGVILREIIFSIVRASWRDRRRNGWDNLFRKFSVVKSGDNNFVTSNRSIIIDTF